MISVLALFFPVATLFVDGSIFCEPLLLMVCVQVEAIAGVQVIGGEPQIKVRCHSEVCF